MPTIVITLLINLFPAQSTLVLGQRIEPNLHQDQRLIMESVGHRWHGPRRGDKDSRYFGPVSNDTVIGRALFR